MINGRRAKRKSKIFNDGVEAGIAIAYDAFQSELARLYEDGTLPKITPRMSYCIGFTKVVLETKEDRE